MREKEAEVGREEETLRREKKRGRNREDREKEGKRERESVRWKREKSYAHPFPLYYHSNGGKSN